MPWRPPAHNIQGRENQYFAAVYHAHAGFCGCGDPIGHLIVIAARYPQAGPAPPAGPQAPAPAGAGGAPPGLPALPAPPHQADNPQPRPTGGDGGAAGGAQDGGDEGPGAYGEEELEELFRAAAEDDM